MSAPVFRNPHLFQVLPLRNYIRANFPTGPQGFVSEDLDLLIRHFGQKYHQDAVGRFMLMDHKQHGATLGGAQQWTFQLLHRTLRAGDPNRERYIGFYVLNLDFDLDDLPEFPALINGIHKLDEVLFKLWMNGEALLPSLWDK